MKNRMQPLGFCVLAVLLIGMSLVIPSLLRPITTISQLSYHVTKILENDEQHYAYDLHFETIGDAVIYQHKKLNFSGDIYRKPNERVININHLNNEHSYVIKNEAIEAVKGVSDPHTNEWLDKGISLYQTLNLDNTHRTKLLKRDSVILLRHLKPFIKKEDDVYIIELNLSELYNVIDQTIEELSEYEDFKLSFIEKANLINEIFTYYNDLNITTENFYERTTTILNDSQKLMTQHFTDDSSIILKIDFQNQILLETKLMYKNCDAYESLNIEILSKNAKNSLENF